MLCDALKRYFTNANLTYFPGARCWSKEAKEEVVCSVAPSLPTQKLTRNSRSKGKVKDKAQHAVILDKTTSEKLYKDVPSYRLVTVATLVDRMKINGSLARQCLAELEEKGIIKPVITHSKMKIYSMAASAALERFPSDANKMQPVPLVVRTKCNEQKDLSLTILRRGDLSDRRPTWLEGVERPKKPGWDALHARCSIGTGIALAYGNGMKDLQTTNPLYPSTSQVKRMSMVSKQCSWIFSCHANVCLLGLCESNGLITGIRQKLQPFELESYASIPPPSIRKRSLCAVMVYMTYLRILEGMNLYSATSDISIVRNIIMCSWS